MGDYPALQAALSRREQSPCAAVHVGDHPGDDIGGAQRAGLRAVWFNPQGKAWAGEQAPDAEIQRLSQLPEVIARWR